MRQQCVCIPVAAENAAEVQLIRPEIRGCDNPAKYSLHLPAAINGSTRFPTLVYDAQCTEMRAQQYNRCHNHIS